MELYTTIGELYNYILSYSQTEGRDLPVPEALRRMLSAGLLKGESAPIPPFEAGVSTERFRDFLQAMPVRAGSLMDSNRGVFPREEEDFFPQGKDVFTFQHMPYSGRELHYHNYFEMTYIVRGGCMFYFEGERIALREGNLCITSNFAWHEAAPKPDCLAVGIIVRKSTFDSLFSGLLSGQDLVSLFFRKCLHDQGNPNYVLLDTGNDTSLFHIMHRLVYETNLTDEYANECAIGLLTVFVAQALRASATNVTLRSYDGYSRQRINFSTILQYIQQNYRSVTLASLSETFYFSQAYLSKLIRQNMGQSFTDVLRQVKMTRARDLLLNTDLKISEISESVGYESVDHFTRTFRRTFGMPPREFRVANNPKSNRKADEEHETT